MEEERKETDLRVQVLEKLSTLAATAFGLVAALAWNDAIQSLFRRFFGEQASLIAKFVYALVVTVLVVAVTIHIGKLHNDLKQELEEKSHNQK